MKSVKKHTCKQNPYQISFIHSCMCFFVFFALHLRFARVSTVMFSGNFKQFVNFYLENEFVALMFEMPM